MSSEEVRQKRCIIQKLDFENCIITNLKTSSSGRKKLRARITREVIPDVPEEKKEKQSCEKSTASILTRSSSPVLLKKQYPYNRSPVFNKRKKFQEIEIEEFSEQPANIQALSSNSPVFKSFKKHKTMNASSVLNENPSERSTSLNEFTSQEGSNSDAQSSFKIEDFTQESKQNVKIFSVESPKGKAATPVVYSVEPISPFLFNSTPSYSKKEEEKESPKPAKRNYKKNSLLGRLHKLQQKQASEKLLWQHQNRKKSSKSLTVSIIDFWKEEFNYFLKCQSCLSGSETTFLIVDSRWVPNVKTVKIGCVLQLQPPWQKLSTVGYNEGTMITVLLNVICMDVLDEIKEPILPKKSFELVPPDLFNTDEKLFINSLFSNYESEFLY